jgi:hypothetical protein
MPDLGQYAAFIIAAYVTALRTLCKLGRQPAAPLFLQSVVEEECTGNGALAVFILNDDRRQRRTLAALERAGVKRRSAQEAAPSVKPKRKRKS